MRNSVRTALSLGVLVGMSSIALPAVAASRASTRSNTALTNPALPNPWHAVRTDTAAPRDGVSPQIRAAHMLTFTLSRPTMQAALAGVPLGSSQTAVVWLPTPAGTYRRFAVQDSPVMMPGLAAAHPEIRTYLGRGLDSTETVRIAMTALGFTASVRGQSGAWYVDPLYHLEQSVYASYFGQDLADTHGPFTERELNEPDSGDTSTAGAPTAATSNAGPVQGETLHNFRLAVLTDPSFASYWGPGNALAGLVTNLNRLEQIYNDELDVSLLLVDNEPKAQLNTLAEAFEPDGPCGAAACFEQSQLAFCSGATLVRNQIVLGQLIGADNYDAGHVTLSNDGGGIAALGVAGTGRKAEGCTGIPDADGDGYVVDYWAHEMGHNFDMNHTFNGDLYNCAGLNRNDATAVEPGSASSIMGYAGICQQDDLQPHSDPYFSQRSDQEAQAYMASKQADVTEIQTASLRHFGGGNEVQRVTFAPLPRQSNRFSVNHSTFRVNIGGKRSALIGGGHVAYTDSGIAGAINAIPGFAGTVTVGGAGKTGFTVAYGGAAANTDVANLSIVDLSCNGCYSAVDEVNHGGTDDSFALSYDGGPASSTLTNGSTYTTAGITGALKQILPAGATATVAPFGDTGTLNNTGFQVTFGGTLAGNQPGGAHIARLALTHTRAGMSGFVGKTTQGGPSTKGGSSQTVTRNAPPVTTAPAGYTIPYRTPFSLTGHATDANGDTVTYMWEQNDAGTGTVLTSAAKANGPLFRQFGTALDNAAYDPHAYGACQPLGDNNGENCVTTNPTRVFPDMAQILAGDTNARTGTCPGPIPPNPKPLKPALVDCLSEWLPTSVYTGPMHFRLTARDGHPGAGGISSADTTVNLAPGTGPFLVTSQATRTSYTGGSHQTVTWKVAGTNAAPIHATEVEILFSSDDGLTFTPLLPTTPNDGSATVTLPDSTTTQARVEVQAVGNVFFAVNASEFTVAARPAAIVVKGSATRVW